MPRRKLTKEEKAEKERLKQIEHDRHMLERDYQEMLDTDIPDPAYIHAVGDRVSYGAWDFTKILEVHDDGKFYKCFSSTTHLNTNRGNVYEEKEHFETWFDLLPYQDKDNWPDRLEEEEDVQLSYQQRQLLSLLMMMSKKYGIDLEPDYQRGNVWTNEQKVALIDSIFKNIDIGKFTIIKRPWGDNPNVPMTPKLYEMLDGKQRITALFEFYTGRFKYKGLYFYELHPRDRNHFRNYVISWAECSPLTDEQKYRYFLKLNTGGSPVDPKHLEKVKEMWEKAKEKK